MQLHARWASSAAPSVTSGTVFTVTFCTEAAAAEQEAGLMQSMHSQSCRRSTSCGVQWLQGSACCAGAWSSPPVPSFAGSSTLGVRLVLPAACPAAPLNRCACFLECVCCSEGHIASLPESGELGTTLMLQTCTAFERSDDCHFTKCMSPDCMSLHPLQQQPRSAVAATAYAAA